MRKKEERKRIRKKEDGRRKEGACFIKRKKERKKKTMTDPTSSGELPLDQSSSAKSQGEAGVGTTFSLTWPVLPAREQKNGCEARKRNHGQTQTLQRVTLQRQKHAGCRHVGSLAERFSHPEPHTCQNERLEGYVSGD